MPTYRNSEKTVQFTYRNHLYPRSEDDLIALLKQGAQEDRRFKVNGGRNTFNHLGKTGDTFIELGGIREFRSITEIDPVRKTATIGGATILADAIDTLHEAGLQFPVLGGWFTQTLGGALATSTHGSCLAHGSLSDSVIALEAILADGTKLHLRDGDPDLPAWRVHLGQLGIVTKVTLQLTDAFYLRAHTEVFPDDRIGFESLFDIVENWDAPKSPYVGALWLPYAGREGKLLVRTLHRSNARRPNAKAIEYEENWAKRDGALLKNVKEDRGAVILGRAFLRNPHRYRELWSNAMANAYLEDHGVEDRSFRLLCHEQFREPTENHLLRLVLSTEIALDIEELPKVLAEIRSLLRRSLDRGIVANYPRFHIRFSEASHRTWLGLNAQRRTAYFNTYFSAAVLRHRQIPLAIAIEKILDAHGGRPHWGKFRHLRHDPRFLETYGENLSRFETYRKKVDPQGIFSDGYDMFRGLDMLDHDSLFVAPFSGLNPNNYGQMRFLGGRSSLVVDTPGVR